MATLLGSVLLLSGCMMPDSEKEGTMIPYEEQLQSVQNAIERYQEASGGLLPIKTRDQAVDQYIKYPIDFAKIVPDYMPEIPPNAFETVAKRPQLQERITSTLADSLMETLNPHGVYVMVEAEHLCMTMRGIKKPGAQTVTAVSRGLLETDDVKRSEVITYINRN